MDAMLSSFYLLAALFPTATTPELAACPRSVYKEVDLSSEQATLFSEHENFRNNTLTHEMIRLGSLLKGISLTILSSLSLVKFVPTLPTFRHLLENKRFHNSRHALCEVIT